MLSSAAGELGAVGAVDPFPPVPGEVPHYLDKSHWVSGFPAAQ